MVDGFTLDLRTQPSIRLKVENLNLIDIGRCLPWSWRQIQIILVDHFLLYQMDWKIPEF